MQVCLFQIQSIKQEQRAQNAHIWGQKDSKVLEGFETNDLGYEDKSQDDQFLYLGIAFNLSADSGEENCWAGAALWVYHDDITGRGPSSSILHALIYISVHA